MDHTGIGGINASSSDHLAVLSVVSHLNQVVDVGVVARCFVVHAVSMAEMGHEIKR